MDIRYYEDGIRFLDLLKYILLHTWFNLEVFCMCTNG